jgi:hypothetical protein
MTWLTSPSALEKDMTEASKIGGVEHEFVAAAEV